jgi:hypothetical protein
MIESDRRIARWYGDPRKDPMPDKGKTTRTTVAKSKPGSSASNSVRGNSGGGGAPARGNSGGGGGGRQGGGRLFARGK